MDHLLAGDVGGTKTALCLYVRQPSGGLEEIASAQYASRDYPALAPMLEDFLRAANGQPRIPSLRAAAFGVAGPVDEGICKATNLPWIVDAAALSALLGAPTQVVNDFHVVALGVLELDPSELCVLHAGQPHPHGPIAILGAGTGLGEVLLVPTSTGPLVLATEGGHTDFAPRNELEIELLRFLLRRHKRVSVERVVSGLGLRNLYEFVVQSGLSPESPTVRREIETSDPGRVIGEHALRGDDAACMRAIDMLVTLYGAEAGNLALKTLPTGGLYLAGGITPRLIDKLRDGAFMRAFLDKGRMSKTLERIRVSAVLNPQVGLYGARRLALDTMRALALSP